ncbi:putative tubby-like protein [Helianthus debilis subsp. tardiflorus]
MAERANPITVVSSNFLAPYTVELMINNLFSISYNFTVTDVAGKVVFKCEYLTFGRRVLLNAARKPILLFQKKMHKKLTLGNEKYALTVYPNVDQAFVVTLVLIMRLTREIDM